jgi:hypothetical protein
VASRNRPDLEEWLKPDILCSKISLGLNSSHISLAVDAFINFKVSELADLKEYDSKLHEDVKSCLCKNTEGTFLWVALVCKELRKVPPWETRSVLEELPPGLDPLYDRMMGQIQQRKDD